MNELNYAGFWWRVLAHIIDACLLLGAYLFFLTIVIIVCAMFLKAYVMDAKTFKSLFQLGLFLINTITQWLYFAMMESSDLQGTVGKKICRLTVTNIDGDRISFQHATGRYWAKWISSIICCIGYLMAAFTERNQALHDRIAHTLVLRQVD